MLDEQRERISEQIQDIKRQQDGNSYSKEDMVDKLFKIQLLQLQLKEIDKAGNILSSEK